MLNNQAKVIKEFQTKFPSVLSLEVLFILYSGPKHGYNISSQIKKKLNLDIHPSGGVIYPLLTRLEKAGYISRSYDTRNVRRRRICHITKNGKDLVESFYSLWGDMLKNNEEMTK